ncbi:hypothetical protein [Mucilaginibacter celer]|uniref:Uncharacterized protein n=1 Tax=Mucilaginibacter celer TaxID=2305508 RepID=A0A494VSP6_9SPHI|nr:hypothetical protein [Mucilaginibacter celer]AYL96410.1 hypothetical protein HYN43_014375 [Mucilaginibacter celer]
MNITARIEEINISTTYPDQNGGQIDSGDVYIGIYDADTNQSANGNNCEVTYQLNNEGSLSTFTVVIPGQSYLLYSGTIRDSSYSPSGDQIYSHWVAYSIVSVRPGNNPSPNPGVCNLSINHISIDKPESAPGAADARITVSASTSYAPILYSIDGGLNWQSSAAFSGLRGGTIQVMVKDNNPLGCTDTAAISIPILTNLLTGDPSVTLPNGYVSRWNAAFNPVVFTYQRKDFSIKSILANADGGHAEITVNGNFNDPATGKTKIKIGDKIYISTNNYNGVYLVEKITGSNSIVIDASYSGNATSGFVNINSMYPYYELYTRITYTDVLTGNTNTIKSINRPDNTGLIRTDISNFLQSLVRPVDNSNYTLADIRDTNLCSSYTIEYAQHYDDGTDEGFTTTYSQIPNPYYVLFAAKQLGDKYGGNMAAYVPNTYPNAEPALWITDFAQPAYSVGYPFDIGFIFTDQMAGLQPYCQLTLLDINRNELPGGDTPSSLQNEDGSWIINEDGSKYIIGNQTTFKIPLTGGTGLHRLMVSANFPPEAFYFTAQIKYGEGLTFTALTKPQIIRIDDAVDDNSVYLRWIGLKGSWNYYRFVYNQEVSLDVQNAVIIKNYVQNWETQQGIEEVISKSAGQKMKVMAEDLSVNDIKGLQSIKYSPKVQMLVNKNPVKWQTIVINTATYSEYETRNGQAPFSVTFNMPSINIQTQ